MPANATILVVDDDANNRTVVAQTLFEYVPAYKVLSASGGKQGLQILEKRVVNLILLDWEMPDMDGMEVLKLLKASEQWRDIPVVLYTGIMTQSQHLKTALELGAADFLRKPADPVELVARIRSILKQQQYQQALLTAERQQTELLRSELQNYLLVLAQKNEVLDDIRQRCEASLKTDKSAKISDVTRYIEQLLQKDDYWANFLGKFSQIDKAFLQRLSTRYPDMTTGEIRYCALLRSGMDNKSIAHLLNISSEGVMKTRYRIRKKMELEGDDKLEKWIFAI